MDPEAVNPEAVEQPAPSAPAADETNAPDLTSSEPDTSSEETENTDERTESGAQARIRELVEERNRWRDSALRMGYAPVQDTVQTAPTPAPTDYTSSQTEDGYIDPVQFQQQTVQQAASQAEQRIYQKLERERVDRELWNEAVEAHPDLKKDQELASVVRGYWLNQATSGNVITYKDAADKIAKIRGKSIEEGQRRAQVSETIQKQAAVETTTRPDEGGDERTKLKAMMRDPNLTSRQRELARQKYLTDYVG